MFAGMERGFSWTYFPLSYTLLKFYCIIIFYLQYFLSLVFACSSLSVLSVRSIIPRVTFSGLVVDTFRNETDLLLALSCSSLRINK